MIQQYIAHYALLQHGYIAFKDIYTISYITRYITSYIVDWYSNIIKDIRKQIGYINLCNMKYTQREHNTYTVIHIKNNWYKVSYTTDYIV